MRSITTTILMFFIVSVALGQDCTNCFDDGPAGCGKLGYYDGDGDGYGTGSQQCFYGNPSYYARKGGDCNDNNASIYPRTFYVDSDGDGYGAGPFGTTFCQGATPPTGYSSNSGDCDDTDPSVNVDQNWYQDADSDGWGDSSTVTFSCEPPPGMINPVNVGGDYDDTTNTITNVQPRNFYYDGDGDGFGATSPSVYQSFAPPNYVTDNTDCNDGNEDINPNTVWYVDSDGDGLGSSTPQNKVQCSQPPNDSYGSYVLSNTDLCPNEFGSQANNGCTNLDPIAVTDDDRNWVWSIDYDADGSIISNGINYFDDLGKSLQNQSIDIKTGKIWADQVMYDHEGMPTFQSLSAPIGAPAQFTYKQDFIRKTNGSTYIVDDFESNEENPSIVGEQNNSLGWYYSDNNTSEPYQDATDYPFSRTVYSTMNPGTPLKNLGGNKINNAWPQAYTFSMPATNELGLAAAFGNTLYNTYEITKTVTRDVHGNENVVFVDTDGKTLAAARSGEGSTSSYMRLNIGAQGYVDVHVPKGITGITLGNSGLVTVYDLITEQPITTSAGSLTNGFYRVAVNDLATYTPNSAYVDYRVNYYDYSLNEYDEAGRLTASYQPLNKLKTEYEYNSLGELVYTKSPDEGEAWFKYREDGQIRYSQNSKQKLANEVSYTEYDEWGRPEESGVLAYSNFAGLNPDGNLPSGARSEQLFTHYDTPYDTSGCSSTLCNILNARNGQAFVNGNVSYTQNNQSTTYYSYDAYGRVVWLVQDIVGLGVKTIDYTYDAVRGTVTEVDYQKNVPAERFIHRYTYNEADQLIKAETSTNGINYELHAEYVYYETGAIKRVEYAGGIQGLDYVYNLAGQLKGINHPNLSQGNLHGTDTNTDLFGMQIDYHHADYLRTNSKIEATVYGTNQLNGNIKGIRWNNDRFASNDPSVYAYDYNRNNWLTNADFGSYVGAGNSNAQPTITNNNTYTGTATLEATQSITLTPGFHAQSGSNFLARIVDTDGFEEIGNNDYDVTGITYDPNGNILTLDRKKNDGSGGTAMDDLTYHYKTGTNQLDHVEDGDNNATGANDIIDQNSGNYTYNAIGQLITDREFVTPQNPDNTIEYFYNAQGLVTEVRKDNLPQIRLHYNERGQRIKKDSYDSNGNLLSTQYYVRDAGGTAMAIYSNGSLAEHTLYGSERLGVYKRADGSSTYQLTDHLGNVRAIFQKHNTNTTIVNEDFNDYYPFGMPMPGRNDVDANFYRYAFQGQEKDPETGKEAFELRLWDNRIGRWLTTDPYGQYNSSYLGMGNNPINGIDPDGGFFFKEYENAAAYYKENPNGKLDGSDGHWLVSDRTNRTDVWNTANLVNLQNVDFEQYSSISQRTAFYGWFQSMTEDLGYETVWAGAAYIVASQMQMATSPLYSPLVSDEIIDFANAGNKAIFDDVLPRLNTLYNGPVLKGSAAKSWDVATLTNEQRDVVHSIYLIQSPETLKQLAEFAKGTAFLGMGKLGIPSEMRFNENDDIMSWEARFNHGMEKAAPYWKKYGRASYCRWCK